MFILTFSFLLFFLSFFRLKFHPGILSRVIFFIEIFIRGLQLELLPFKATYELGQDLGNCSNLVACPPFAAAAVAAVAAAVAVQRCFEGQPWEWNNLVT